AMEKRTKLYQKGDKAGIDALEKELLKQNAEHKDWACTEEMMSLTKDGKALYLHCLPADITGLSCEEGEVDNSVFDRYIVPLYKQASYSPDPITAMMFLAKVRAPVKAPRAMDASEDLRKKFWFPGKARFDLWESALSAPWAAMPWAPPSPSRPTP